MITRYTTSFRQVSLGAQNLDLLIEYAPPAAGDGPAPGVHPQTWIVGYRGVFYLLLVETALEVLPMPMPVGWRGWVDDKMLLPEVAAGITTIVLCCRSISRAAEGKTADLLPCEWCFRASRCARK